jgi:negative regulator of genetic competence, sporulation and motility
LKFDITYKHITAIIFFAALLAQTFSKSFVMADYYTNTSKYAKNCVNKAKPKMQCNGKCQMMKKLQQEEKKDQENPERKAENKNEIILSSKSFYAVVNTTYKVTIIKQAFPQIADDYSYNCTSNIFHPPKV